MTAQLLRDVSHADYHLDNLPGAPHFSRTTALQILAKSARHAFLAHPKLGGAEEGEAPPTFDDTEATDAGSLIHGLLLERGQPVRVVEHKDWRTGDAKAQREAARLDGALPVLRRTWEEGTTTAALFRQKLVALGVPMDECLFEVTIVWRDEEGVSCKIRIDILHPATGRSWDLKVTGSPPGPGRKGRPAESPHTFRENIGRKGLDVQAYAYEQGIWTAYPEHAGRGRLSFLLLENRPPWEPAVIPVGETRRAVGRTRWLHARGIWQRGLESGIWPGYGVLAPAEARPWELTEAMIEAIETSEPDWTKGE